MWSYRTQYTRSSNSWLTFVHRITQHLDEVHSHVISQLAFWVNSCQKSVNLFHSVSHYYFPPHQLRAWNWMMLTYKPSPSSSGKHWTQTQQSDGQVIQPHNIGLHFSTLFLKKTALTDLFIYNLLEKSVPFCFFLSQLKSFWSLLRETRTTPYYCSLCLRSPKTTWSGSVLPSPSRTTSKGTGVL